jgi:hypothetical protein
MKFRHIVKDGLLFSYIMLRIVRYKNIGFFGKIYGSGDLHVSSKVSVFSTFENIVAETSENVFLK